MPQPPRHKKLGKKLIGNCFLDAARFNVWIAPKRDFALLVCINQRGDRAFTASDDAVGALMKLHSGGATH